MQPDQIVMSKMQGDRCLQVFKLLAESIGESGKTPHAHPHIEILPLNADQKAGTSFVSGSKSCMIWR
jgi:hypothetical protein